MFNVSESIKAQRKYCEDNKAPHFAPSTGTCWICWKNIYTPHEYLGNDRITKFTSGIKVEKAATQLVTGCPHCNRSYCD